MAIFRRKRRSEDEPGYEDEQRALLEARPFVPENLIEHVRGRQEITRDEQVFVDRIVTGASHEVPSWYQAGRIKKLQDGRLVDSYEYAKELALNRAYAVPSEDKLVLFPFKDATGEEWFGVSNGQHRVTAAMLNNELYLTADIEWPVDGDNFYPGDVQADYIDK